MNNKIILKDGETLIGVSGIVISKLDNTIFINNSAQIQEGTEGSLAFYCQDGMSTLHSTGDECKWDNKSATLTVNFLITENLTTKKSTAQHLTTKQLTTENLTTEKLTTEKLMTKDINITNRITFNNFEIKERSKEVLSSFLRNSHRNNLLVEFIDSDAQHTLLIAIDKERTYLNCNLNMKSKTIVSSIGCAGDLKGDIAVDEDFIYYCTKDFDSISNIWKRSSLTTW